MYLTTGQTGKGKLSNDLIIMSKFLLFHGILLLFLIGNLFVYEIRLVDGWGSEDDSDKILGYRKT